MFICKYRGVKIHVGSDGIFYADLEESRITSTTVSSMKQKISRLTDAARRFVVPAELLVLYDLPNEGLQYEARLEHGGGVFRGFNLSTRSPKVRFDGKEDDIGTWHNDDPWEIYALPVNTGPELAADVERVVEQYNTAREALKAILETLRDWIVSGLNYEAEDLLKAEIIIQDRHARAREVDRA